MSPAEQFALNRLINYGRSAEGPVLPPAQNGALRVPLVARLRVAKVVANLGASVFTLVWDSPQEPNIAGYNIYHRSVFDNTLQLQGPIQVSDSPAEVRVSTDRPTNIAFFVQTVLRNGMVSEIEYCPATSASTVDASGNVTTGDLAPSTPGAVISFLPTSGNPTIVVPGLSGYALRSNGSGQLPSYRTITRYLGFWGEPVTVSGSPSWTTSDNVRVIRLPNAANSAIKVWFKIPPDANVAADMALVLSYRPQAAPGGTNNVVRLTLTAKTQNTTRTVTAGDSIIMADDTNWASYTGTANVVEGGDYAVNDIVGVTITRDTGVANNAGTGIDIGTISLSYSAL